MALRRELLPILLAAAFLLTGAGEAVAAPTWLPGETRDAASGLLTAPDVATDRDGNSVAVWPGAGGAARGAYRPRGGPWGAAEGLDLLPALAGPLVTARSNGEFVAVWVADLGAGGPSLRSATRSTGGQWTAETVRDSCCDDVEALEGTADGSVTVVVREDGPPSSNTKGPGSAAWGPRQPLSISGYDRFAFAPDGSTVGVRLAGCGDTFDCLEASYRSPGAEGGWGDPESVPGASPAANITGYGVGATPSSGYTVVWGETPTPNAPDAPEAVRSSDRTPGSGGAWASPLLVASLPGTPPTCSLGNCFDLAVGADGGQVAVWQSGGREPLMSAALRNAGGPWAGAVETVGPVGSSGAVPFAAVTSRLVPVVAWGNAGSGDGAAHASHRDPGTRAWNPVTRSARPRGGPPPGVVALADIAADDDGNALTAWTAPSSGVISAGFDGAGPRFNAFSLPVGGTAGQSLGFSAAAGDAWSGVASISWLFGDGSGAPGAAVSHAYAAGGAFGATARATDGVGNVTERSGAVAVAPPPAVLGDCGGADADRDGIGDVCDDNNGAKAPVPFKTVNATVVSGEVFVKLPAGSASASQAKPPKGFVRLEGAETIPVGATLDTANGRVKVRSAADTRRRTQTGQFFRGRFLIRQVRIKRRSRTLITDMRLTGSSFQRTCRTTASVSQRRRRSKKRVRRLFGDAKGTFRTSGRNAAATVRGTRWGVQDRCDGTLVAVQRGRVEVRDKVKRKTIILRAGKTYLARAR